MVSFLQRRRTAMNKEGGRFDDDGRSCRPCVAAFVLFASIAAYLFTQFEFVSITNRQWEGSKVLTDTPLIKEDAKTIRTSYIASLTEEEGSKVLTETTLINKDTKRTRTYAPSPTEDFVAKHAVALGYSIGGVMKKPDGCNLWRNASHTKANVRPKDAKELPASFYDLHLNETLHRYRTVELPKYNQLLREFVVNNDQPTNKEGGRFDVRTRIREDGDYSVCDSLELHPDGLEGLFPSGALSKVEGNAGAGYVEPMLPPFRHPDFCFVDNPRKGDMRFVLNMEFMVHDFAAMCRTLKPHSRLVFVDIGASLDIHKNMGMQNPGFYVTELYEKFGFPFDHVYAYEIKKKDPNRVYSMLPQKLKAAYHWYNVGVNASFDSPNNPFLMLAETYTEDDYIVVKMDIDTATIEVPMVKLLLGEGKGSDNEDERLRQLRQKLPKIVDAFYFEHHVYMRQMAWYWKKTARGTILDSFRLFTGLRKLGIAAHSWV